VAELVLLLNNDLTDDTDLHKLISVNAGIASSTLVNSVLVLFIIVAITSGFKVWQAISSNPIKLLRTE